MERGGAMMLIVMMLEDQEGGEGLLSGCLKKKSVRARSGFTQSRMTLERAAFCPLLTSALDDAICKGLKTNAASVKQQRKQ